MSSKSVKSALTAYSERVVVDEVFDDGLVRLLRAKRKSGKSTSLGLDYWEDETIDVMSSWRVEAFVGFPTQRHVREGDVFYLIDGRELSDDYKAINRGVARKTHLLMDWDEGREFAREEIKREVRTLSVISAESNKAADRKKVTRMVNRSLTSASQRKE